MIRKVIPILVALLGAGEKLTDSRLGIVQLTCRGCNQKGTPVATAVKLRLSSRWGWLHLLRRLVDILSLGDEDSELELEGQHWSQMDVPKCPSCGHYPMRSRRGWQTPTDAEQSIAGDIETAQAQAAAVDPPPAPTIPPPPPPAG